MVKTGSPMARMQAPGVAAWFSLLFTGLFVLPIPAAAGAGPAYMEIPAYQAPNLTAVNTTLANATRAPAPALTPITLLHLELNETVPTGVRYMAFSPKIIEIAANPLLLVILAALIVAGAGGWYFLGRRGKGG